MNRGIHYRKYLKYKQKYHSLKQQQGGRADPASSLPEKSLYDRLGGIFAIAAVVDYFSDAVVNNPLVGKNSPNPDLRNWTRNQIDRLPGLKFMRTSWVCEITDGPCNFTPTVLGETCHLSLEKAHEKFHIAPKEFDEVAKLLKEALEHFNVPTKESNEVLSAFASHKNEVTKGYFDKIGQPMEKPIICPYKETITKAT